MSRTVNPSSSRHEIRFSKRYCQFRTAFLLARLMWTFCGTLGVRPYPRMILLMDVICSLTPVSARTSSRSSLGVHLPWLTLSIIWCIVSRLTLVGLPPLGRPRRPSRPPAS